MPLSQMYVPSPMFGLSATNKTRCECPAAGAVAVQVACTDVQLTGVEVQVA